MIDAPTPWRLRAGGALSRLQPRRRLDVLLALSQADFRARYGRGAFRIVRWLVDPFALLGIYMIMVVFVLNRPGAAPGLALACAIVPFQLIMSSAVSAIASIQTRQSIILNMAFDRTIIPAATVLTETIAYVASLSMIALMMGVYAVGPTGSLLWFPALFVMNVALAAALAYPAALFGVWFKELRVFMISLVRATFFLAPSLVPLSDASPRAQTFLRLNPLTGLFEAYRNVVIYGRPPGLVNVAYPLVFCAVVLAVFLPIFQREQTQLAKVVE